MIIKMFNQIKLLAFPIFFCFSLPMLHAQEIDLCSTDRIYEELIQSLSKNELESMERATEELELLSHQYQKNPDRKKSSHIYTIPVVFHILHQNGGENISDEQIFDALRVVNEDFRKQNADTSETVAAFQGIAADTEIDFKLATLDPEGNCTNGIDRIYSIEAYEGTDSSKINQWPREKYLNIWVVAKIKSGAAGYAYYPASTITGNHYKRDGIVILNSYVGSIGTGNNNRSRALTHEIGHYLNLAHLWGSTNHPEVESNCDFDDGVFDTPLTKGHTSCRLSARTCDGSLDNVQNYMEYTYCYTMFTKGQRDRMHATLNSSIAGRNNLHSTQNLIETGLIGIAELCKADFGVSSNFGCINDSVVFYDLSYHNPTNWLWDLEGAVPTRPIGNQVEVYYPNEGVFDADLVVLNPFKSLHVSKKDYIYIFDTIADYRTADYKQDFEKDSFPSDWISVPSYFNNRFSLADTGSKSSSSVYIDNFNYSEKLQKFSIISPSFDFAYLEAPKLGFHYAFSIQDANNNDQFSIYNSTDCGKNWNLQFTLSGSSLSTATSNDSSAFVPGMNDWGSFTFPIAASARDSANVLLKFEFISGGGNNFYLDNINISGKVVGIKENNISPNAIVYPNPFKKELKIQLRQDSKNVSIELYDLQGKKLKQLYNSSNHRGNQHFLSFNLEELPSGMFFVRIYADNNNSYSYKIVKH